MSLPTIVMEDTPDGVVYAGLELGQTYEVSDVFWDEALRADSSKGYLYPFMAKEVSRDEKRGTVQIVLLDWHPPRTPFAV